MPTTRPDNNIRRQAIKLRLWARWAAGFLGLVGLGSGGTAVYVTHIEAGPVALIAVGAVFMLVALAGVLPTRLKVGDNEAEWVEVGVAVAAVVESASAQDKSQLVTNLGRLAGIAPSAAAPALAAFDYEDFIENLIGEVLAGHPSIKFERASMDPHDGRPDSILYGPDGRRVIVEITMLPWTSNRNAIFASRFAYAQRTIGAQGMLLVLSQSDPYYRDAQARTALPNALQIVVRDNRDSAGLLVAINEVMKAN
jgi:hypothetical protein